MLYMNLARLLILTGVALIAVGALLMLLNRLHIPIGRLPGDVVWRNGRTTASFPWVTCLLLSVIATLLLWLIGRR
jgi:hypothetical protein